jgi:polyene glycosyltransferase
MVVDANSAWAIDAAQTRGVPFVLSMPMPASSVFLDRLPKDYPTPFSGLPRTMDAAQQRQNRKFRRGLKLTFFRPSTLRSMLDAVNQRKKAGIVNVNGTPSRYADAARAVIGYSTFDVEYAFPAVPDHLTMVGHAVAAEPESRLPGTELGEWLDAHESVVYIGFGSIMRLTGGQVRAVLDACRELGDRHAVLWKLPKSQRALLPPDSEIPATVRFEDWVPSQLEVLAHPHVRVFFNHGGGNAVHEALYHDKPQLVMPFWTDCYDLAARVVDRGVGLDVPNVENPDPAQIAAALLRVLTEDPFRARAAGLGARIRAAGGPPTAVDVVEKALTAHR